MKPTDIRVESVTYSYDDMLYRTPIKFGGIALDRVTIVNVDVTVRTRAGQTSRGFGSMPLGNVWSFPSKALTYDQTLGAMKAVVERIAKITRNFTETAHPIDLTWALEHDYVKAGQEVSNELHLNNGARFCCSRILANAATAESRTVI